MYPSLVNLKNKPKENWQKLKRLNSVIRRKIWFLGISKMIKAFMILTSKRKRLLGTRPF